MIHNKRVFFLDLLRNFRTQRQLWLLSIPIIVWVAVFCYYPMYGIIYGFFDYKPGMDLMKAKYVGLKHITDFIMNPIFLQLIRNTLAMSTLSLTVGFVAPIIFALLLNEIVFVKYKKVLQTISYLPHFVSWVVAGSMVYMILSSEGIINEILVKFGIIPSPVPFLQKGEYYWMIYTATSIWKNLGWSSIIYLSAIAGVDVELYEAGAIDGMSRMGRVWYIILPTIAPTIIMLWILGIGDILNAGFDQHLILGNPLTQNYWDVIDTYAYRYGIQQGKFSMGIAISLAKSMIGFILVYTANRISKKVFSLSLF